MTDRPSSSPPKTVLDPNTTFTFEVNGGLKDAAGASFQTYALSFTTGASANATDAPIINVDQPTLFFSDISNTVSGGYGPSVGQKISCHQHRVAPLLLSNGSLSFVGINASQFALASAVSLPATVRPGGSLDSTSPSTHRRSGFRTAQLKIVSNDPDHPSTYVNLRGLGTAGEGGNLEPVASTYSRSVSDPGQRRRPHPRHDRHPVAATSGDGLDLERLSKAGGGPVTIEMLANFANSSSPSTRFGWYSPGQITDRNQLFTVGTASAQTVRPAINGVTTFDPGGDFSIYGEFPAFNNRVVASEHIFNTWGNQCRAPAESAVLSAEERGWNRCPQRVCVHIRRIRSRVRSERHCRHHSGMCSLRRWARRSAFRISTVCRSTVA